MGLRLYLEAPKCQPHLLMAGSDVCWVGSHVLLLGNEQAVRS